MPAENRPISYSFICKLSSMLSDENKNIIRRNEDSSGFIIIDINEFARNILPKFFKTNKLSSFIRQLNYYGFHKDNTSVLPLESREFKHSQFKNYLINNNHKDNEKDDSNGDDNINVLKSENEKLRNILREKENAFAELHKRYSDLEKLVKIESKYQLQFLNNDDNQLMNFSNNYYVPDLSTDDDNVYNNV